MITDVNIGVRFNRWVILELQSKRPLKYICICECGKTSNVYLYDLKSDKSKSCGCLRSEQISKRNKENSTHNLWGTKVYKSWTSMLARCTNPNNLSYPRYGGRGITVDSSWSSFNNFYKDMGDPPGSEYSLGRIDNNLNYCKSNCRWETQKQQANNRSNNTLITFNGETKSLSEWATLFNLKSSTLSRRIFKLKWEIERALTTRV